MQCTATYKSSEYPCQVIRADTRTHAYCGGEKSPRTKCREASRHKGLSPATEAPPGASPIVEFLPLLPHRQDRSLTRPAFAHRSRRKELDAVARASDRSTVPLTAPGTGWRTGTREASPLPIGCTGTNVAHPHCHPQGLCPSNPRRSEHRSAYRQHRSTGIAANGAERCVALPYPAPAPADPAKVPRRAFSAYRAVKVLRLYAAEPPAKDAPP